MGNIIEINKKIVQPGLHSITDDVNLVLQKMIKASKSDSGLLYLFCMHTSCALILNESYDESAKKDLEKFLNHLAPDDLDFIEHVLEGPDDSPAHMKTALLNQHITLPVLRGAMLLGRWQGIFLAEFRKRAHERKILVKFVPD